MNALWHRATKALATVLCCAAWVLLAAWHKVTHCQPAGDLPPSDWSDDDWHQVIEEVARQCQNIGGLA